MIIFDLEPLPLSPIFSMLFFHLEQGSAYLSTIVVLLLASFSLIPSFPNKVRPVSGSGSGSGGSQWWWWWSS